ncbi:MAG TPA: hypothetical protein VFE30_10800 [Anaeromyxobacteraceae bacterium]|jgi:hypothetical protein|nr:hypothetical protein [Anaeromyxobacteraceae bacterium]
MAQNPGQLKRIKEAGRREKQKDKAERKEQRRRESEERRKSILPGEDPDLAGIKPGPQPLLED